MKLGNAAVEVVAGITRGALVVSFVAGVMSAGSAFAGSGLDLDEAAKPASKGECSALIKMRYPFLSCAGNDPGTVPAVATWENSRQIPTQSEFIEGHGFWGPEHNQGMGAEAPLPYQGD